MVVGLICRPVSIQVDSSWANIACLDSATVCTAACEKQNEIGFTFMLAVSNA